MVNSTIDYSSPIALHTEVVQVATPARYARLLGPVIPDTAKRRSGLWRLEAEANIGEVDARKGEHQGCEQSSFSHPRGEFPFHH